MSLDLHPLDAGDFPSPYGHVDPDGDVLAVPADEQPVPGWDDDELYRDER
jgi:hypothetical protein